MAGYITTVQKFRTTASTEILLELQRIYPDASHSQVNAWDVLIRDIKQCSNLEQIPDSAVIALELSVFVENRSIDLLIAGSTPSGENAAFLIESKQWSDDYIQSNRFSNYRQDSELLHPQVQIHHHFLALKEYIKTEPTLHRCHPFVYIRNATEQGCNELRGKNRDVASNDIAITNRLQDILEIIAEQITGTSLLTPASFANATYSPSRRIIDAMSAIVRCEVPFILTDEQELAMKQIRDFMAAGKRVIQISGSAGSGKTAILLNLFVRFLRQDKGYKPYLVSGAQNTHLYKTRYPSVAGLFNFSHQLKKAILSDAPTKPIVFLDEAQQNQSGIISGLLSIPSITLILCYDEWQTIEADNALKELKELRKRDDFAYIPLNQSVRFHNSQVFESNVKSYLSSAKPPVTDEQYDFRIISSFEELKQQTHTLISAHPEYEVAVMGLLSDDAEETAKQSNGFFHTDWNPDKEGNKAETRWFSYIKDKNYLSQYNGSLWLGTWWMPGLDVDYTILIVGDNAKMTSKGFVGIPHHSRNYKMIIGIAKQLAMDLKEELKQEQSFQVRHIKQQQSDTLDQIVQSDRRNAKKVEAILNYLDKPGNQDLRGVFRNSFSLYLRNMHYIMMTRGTKGCLVYFKNQE